jgi:membrane protease YdiL (CAAX protease family)
LLLAGICAVRCCSAWPTRRDLFARRRQVRLLGERPALLDALLYGILALSPAGWFTGLLFWRTQSLLAPILVHAAVDAVAHAVEFIEALDGKPARYT